MKTVKFKSFLLAVMVIFPLSAHVQAFEERVVATVNGTPILASQVQQALGKKANTSGNRLQVLDTIVDDMLVQKAIRDSGVKVDTKQVERVIEGIAAENGLTYGQLLDALDYQGITLNQFRKQIADQMLMAEVRNLSIGKNLDVTREQVESLSKQMLQNAKENEKKVMGTEYQVRHILLKLNPLLNDTQAKNQLNQIRTDIIGGKITFTEAAKTYSKDYLSGANGGDLGFAFPESYVGEFAQAVKNTKPNSISTPFKSEYGWHILEVTATRQADRTQDAYLQKAYETLINKELQEDSKNWIRALRRGSEIKYFNP